MDDGREYENFWDCFVFFVIGLCLYVFESIEGFVDVNEVFVSWSEDLFLKVLKKYGSYLIRKVVFGKFKFLKLKISFRIGGLFYGNFCWCVENGCKEMIEYFVNFIEDDLIEKIVEIYMVYVVIFGLVFKGC